MGFCERCDGVGGHDEGCQFYRRPNYSRAYDAIQEELVRNLNRAIERNDYHGRPSGVLRELRSRLVKEQADKDPKPTLAFVQGCHLLKRLDLLAQTETQ